MHKERDSRGRFISIGRSSIPTLALTPPIPRCSTPSTETDIPLFAGRNRRHEVHRSEIQPKDSTNSSTEFVVEPTSPTEGTIFLYSTEEKLLAQELEVPSEEEG